MDRDTRRRLSEAVEQARDRASEAVSELEREPDAPRAIESAIREAQESLTRIAEKLKVDG